MQSARASGIRHAGGQQEGVQCPSLASGGRYLCTKRSGSECRFLLEAVRVQRVSTGAAGWPITGGLFGQGTITARRPAGQEMKNLSRWEGLEGENLSCWGSGHYLVSEQKQVKRSHSFQSVENILSCRVTLSCQSSLPHDSSA